MFFKSINPAVALITVWPTSWNAKLSSTTITLEIVGLREPRAAPPRHTDGTSAAGGPQYAHGQRCEHRRRAADHQRAPRCSESSWASGATLSSSFWASERSAHALINRRRVLVLRAPWVGTVASLRGLGR